MPLPDEYGDNDDDNGLSTIEIIILDTEMGNKSVHHNKRLKNNEDKAPGKRRMRVT